MRPRVRLMMLVAVPAAALATVPSGPAVARARTGQARAAKAHARREAPRERSPETKPAGCDRVAALCCAPHEAPCERPGPARALLLSLGAIAGASAAGILFALGDRLANGDPATILVGSGALAGIGTLFGIVAGRSLGDGPALADRVRRETLGLSLTGGGTRVLGESLPPSLGLRFGPTWWIDEGSRLRLVGELVGLLGAERHVDPRPQLADAGASGPGTQPAALSQRRVGLTLGLDLAVALPYPILERSAHLGRAELRWRPEIQWRREWTGLGDSGVRVVERTMLLPLLVGARWHVAPRQRFTIYVGPRFDIVSYSAQGGRTLARGKPNVGPMYAEAWYDIDVPLTVRPRRDGRERRADATSMFTVGYIHSRFGGRGFNLGPVIGFLGPIAAEYTVRGRPRGAKAAVQLGAGALVGNGFRITGTVGVVLPDFGKAPGTTERRARRRRSA